MEERKNLFQNESQANKRANGDMYQIMPYNLKGNFLKNPFFPSIKWCHRSYNIYINIYAWIFITYSNISIKKNQ